MDPWSRGKAMSTYRGRSIRGEEREEHFGDNRPLLHGGATHHHPPGNIHETLIPLARGSLVCGGGVGCREGCPGGPGGGGGEVNILFGCDFADQLQMRRNSSADIAPCASHDHREALLTFWILEIFL